jgi:hypothetical protein
MPKLHLSIEELAVESFEPIPAPVHQQGTVRGHQETETCFNTACGYCYTVEYYCGGSADGSCDGSLCNGSCQWPYPETYDATCPAPCRTQGVYC